MTNIHSLFKEGIERYRLIEDGDRILAAVSGGKDSLTMLSFLAELRQQSDLHFDILAINIKTDFHCGSCIHEQVLTDFFKKAGVEYLIRHTKVLDENRKTNCFWCSWNRRKTLFFTANEFNCNKVAFGHHKDDMVETTLLNLFFRGEISTMRPSQEMFEGKLRIIRPLWMVNESQIREFAAAQNFPSQMCQCPFGALSQRKKMKNFIQGLSTQFPDKDIRENIVQSLLKSKN